MTKPSTLANTVSLRLPPDLKLLPLLVHTVIEAAKHDGFTDSQAAKIGLAAEEAASNVVKHALPQDDEDNRFEVDIEFTDLGLGIIFKERGVPFDPSLIADYDPAHPGAEAKGLGVYLMRKLMDKVQFKNLGWEGKETRLFKYRASQRVGDTLTGDQHLEVERQRDEPAVPAGSVPFYIRRMNPEEAVEVSINAFMSYGYTYPYENIYHPDRVRELNARDELISFLAVSEDNDEVMGHAALIPTPNDPKTGEYGVAFVKPRFRGHGCLKRLSAQRLAEAKLRGMVGLLVQGVTTHPFSQKPAVKKGFAETALQLSYAHPESFRGIEQVGSQRESLIVLYRYLEAPAELALYTPKCHADFIQNTYRRLGVELVRKEVDVDFLLPERHTRIEVNTKDYNSASITVRDAGQDALVGVASALHSLCNERVETIYLHLRMSDPATALLTSEFQALGFFYCGVIPGSVGCDELVLQYLNNQTLDLGRLKFASDSGRNLLAYIQSGMPQ